MFSLTAFSLGIILSQQIYFNLFLSLSLSISLFVSLIIINYKLNPGYFKVILISSLMLALGFNYSQFCLNLNLQSQIKSPIPNLALTGYINDLPNLNLEKNFVSTKFTITQGNFKSHTILLYYPNAYNLIPGKLYQIKVKLTPVNNPQKPFIANGWLNAASLHKNQPIFNWSLVKIRYQLVNHLTKILAQEEYKGIAIALISGYTGLISPEIWDKLRQSGIIHLISISGLHIAIFAIIISFIFNYLLNFLPVTKTPKPIIIAWLAVISSLIYALISGFSIPAQRSWYFIIISAYLLTSRRTFSLLYKLAISLSFILIITPQAYLTPGFWFSFILVGLIFYLSASTGSKLYLWLNLQIALALASLPLSLYFFNNYPVISIITNLWAIPTIGNFITPLLVVSGIFHLDYFTILSVKLMSYCFKPIIWLSHAPGFSYYSPSIGLILTYFIGLLLIFSPRVFYLQKTAGLIFALSIFFIQLTSIPYGQSQIISFGNTNSNYSLITTQQHTLLVAISNNSLHLTNFQLNNYLKKEQIKNIEYLITNQSQIIKELNAQNIKIKHQLIKPQNLNIDGVDFSLNFQTQKLNLVIKPKNQTIYIGNGVVPTNYPLFNYIIFLGNDFNQLNELKLHNLILSTKKVPLQLEENLNFSANIYLVNQANGVIIKPDSKPNYFRSD